MEPKCYPQNSYSGCQRNQQKDQWVISIFSRSPEKSILDFFVHGVYHSCSIEFSFRQMKTQK